MKAACRERERRSEASQAGGEVYFLVGADTTRRRPLTFGSLRLNTLVRHLPLGGMEGRWYTQETEPTTAVLVDETIVPFFHPPVAPAILRIRLVGGTGNEAQNEDNVDFTPVVADPVRDGDVLTD